MLESNVTFHVVKSYISGEIKCFQCQVIIVLFNMNNLNLKNDLLNKLEAKQPYTDNEMDAIAKLFYKYEKYFNFIDEFYFKKLSQSDRARFLIWFLKRWAGIDLIDKDELEEYKKIIDMVKSQNCEKIIIGSNSYKLMDLNNQGYDINLVAYVWVLGVHDFYYDQYRHNDFDVLPGDVIIDGGAFIGDTAALFNYITYNNCFVHSFELLDENIELLKINAKINNFEDNIKINKLALSDVSGQKVNIKQTPLQGATSIFGVEGGESVETITLDDYVHHFKVDKVDLIKLDIEGAERYALNGAVRTIQQFKPRLAICVYHCWDDIIELPRIIGNFGVEYKYSFKWVQLFNGWEAVLFANPV